MVISLFTKKEDGTYDSYTAVAPTDVDELLFDKELIDNLKGITINK